MCIRDSNIGARKSGDLGLLESDIRGVVEAAAGTLVKVIIECCYPVSYTHLSDYVKLGGQYMLETEGYELIYDEASNRVTGVKAKGHDLSLIHILLPVVLHNGHAVQMWNTKSAN